MCAWQMRIRVNLEGFQLLNVTHLLDGKTLEQENATVNLKAETRYVGFLSANGSCL